LTFKEGKEAIPSWPLCVGERRGEGETNNTRFIACSFVRFFSKFGSK